MPSNRIPIRIPIAGTVISIVLLVSALPLIGAQVPAAMLSAEDLRALTQTAVAGASNDDDRLAALDGLVKARLGAFDLYPIVLNTPPTLAASATPPYLAYRQSLKERLRKMEPTNTIPFAPVVSIVVVPTQANAPDVIKVVVVRNGSPVQSVVNSLAAHEFKNGLGVTTIMHAGEVTFPVAAFAPGGLVVVTLIPESGENMVTPLKVEWLSRFK